MSYHIERADPLTHEHVTVSDVTVTAVHPDGTYDIVAPGWGEDRNLSPDTVPLCDEMNNEVDVSEIAFPLTNEALQQQLLETQAALTTMYETITAILSGGAL